MKKIIIPIAVLLLVAGIVFATKKNKQPTQQQQQDQAQIQEQNGEDGDSMKASIQEMMAKGKKLKCEWSDDQGNKGVMYTDGQRVKTEMSYSQQQTQNMNDSYMVHQQDTVYVWQANSDVGQMFKEQDFEQFQEEAEEMQDEAEDVQVPKEAQVWQNNYDFKCESWKVDDSVFQVPDDVEFKDMTEVMKQAQEQVQEQMQQVQQQMQGMCDQLSGAAKEECLKGMQQMEQMAQ